MPVCLCTHRAGGLRGSRSGGGPVRTVVRRLSPGAPPPAELGLVAGRSSGLLCHQIPPESLLSSPAAPEPAFQGGTLSFQRRPPAAAFGPDGACGVMWPFGGHSLVRAAGPWAQVSYAGEDRVGGAVSKPGTPDLAARSYFRLSMLVEPGSSTPPRLLLSLMSPVAERGLEVCVWSLSVHAVRPCRGLVPAAVAASSLQRLHAVGFPKATSRCSGGICEAGALWASCGQRVLTSLPLGGRHCPVKTV